MILYSDSTLALDLFISFDFIELLQIALKFHSNF